MLEDSTSKKPKFFNVIKVIYLAYNSGKYFSILSFIVGGNFFNFKDHYFWSYSKITKNRFCENLVYEICYCFYNFCKFFLMHGKTIKNFVIVPH